MSKKLPTISIVVMAHESRAEWFEYLKQRLGDVPFSIDDNVQRLGTWGNCRRAWSMMDTSAEYGLVVQDDAIVCKDFVRKAKRFIAAHPGQSYQFFYGNRPSTAYEASASTTKHKGYIVSDMKYGVAIALPMHLVQEMLDYCDALGKDMPDDSRIKRFCKSKGLRTFYPFPSLIDHRVAPSLVAGNDRMFGERRAISYIDRLTIPPVIHQIWIGPRQEPQRYTRTWHTVPGVEYKMWGENDLKALPMKNQKLYDYYMDRKIYFGAADVARLEILDQFGGLYIDADTERLKDWQEWGWLDSGFVAVRANTAPRDDYRVANGIIGSVPGHPIIREYIKRMGKAKVVEPCWSTIGGTMLTQIVEEHIADDDITILEPYWFYPFNSRNYKSKHHREAIARHVWGSTKGLYKI